MENNRKKARIGIFDSGFGGLTVMRAICDLLPSENVIYLGDTARLPYGDKSQETIIRYSLDNAYFLLSKEIEVLVIACHTASCYAKETLEKLFHIPIVEVVTPAVQLAYQLSQKKKIAVLGTQGTISSGMYQNKLKNISSEIEVFPVPCPLFVHLVEDGLTDHEATEMIAKHYLSSLLEKDIDVAILACTHYPLLQKTIQKVLGPQVKLIDPSLTAAEKIQSLLYTSLSNQKEKASDHQFFVSDNPQKFQRLGKDFLQRSIDSVLLKPN